MNLPLAEIMPRTLAVADYAVLAIYFAINLGIGWWCARRRLDNNKDFFLGGGRIKWWASGISYFATGISSVSFMAIPAKTYSTDWQPIGSAPASVFAGVVVGLVFVGILQQLNSTTIFGYLERRFDRRVRLLAAGLAVLLKIFGRMSVIMLLPALGLSTVTGLNVYISILLMGVITTIYATEGGFEAVIWTDVLQVCVMFGGISLALWFAAQGVEGGIGGIIEAGRAATKFNLVSWEWDFTRPTVWVFVGMFMGSIFISAADQPLMQRAFATPGKARRTVITGSLLGLLSPPLFFFFGTALFVFYRHHPERLLAGLPNDAIVPYFIVNELPSGLAGLIIAGLFAASMGALSSTMNSMAAIVVTDFQLVLSPDVPERSRVRLARLSTLGAGLIATGMAMWIASLGVASLWDETLKLLALVGGGFPGVFALGFLTRRANASGVLVGACASVGATWWVQNYTHVNVFLHSFVAVSSCIVVGYAASLLFGGRVDRERLAGLTVWDAIRTPRPKQP